MKASSNSRPFQPVVTPHLRRLLSVVFLLFALLALNSVYLTSITLLELVTGGTFQNFFYLAMFLVHLILGLLLILPFVVFGAMHLRRAVHRPNRHAVRAGVTLYLTALLLLITGLLLTRFGFLELNDPILRSLVYWAHVISPLVVIWLFILHRLAGSRINWRSGGYWSGATAVFATAMLVIHLVEEKPSTATVNASYPPAQTKVQGEHIIPPEHLMIDSFCAECHQEIAEQAAMSMHRFSSFNNPAYRFSIDEGREVLLQRDGTVRVARLCAACHDQVPLFSGKFDDPDYAPDEDPGSQAGITCVGCHAISAINSPLGNGAYTLTDPPRYPFAFSDNALLKAVNRQLIKAKPAFHKKTFLKPVHKTALFCSSCHKVHLPYALNHYRWLRGQDHYDSFLLSGVSGHRVDSFYYPSQAVANCAQCHMPLIKSDDPAARDFKRAGHRSIHSHLFPAANTAVPYLLDNSKSGNEIRQGMLRQAARVDIFGIREDGEIDGALLAPLRPQLPLLIPGEKYLLEAVIRTLGIGHHLTQGTSDSNELWLEMKITAGDRVIGRSGGLNNEGDVDPWSYFVNSYLLDRFGRRIERRNAQDVFVTLYDHQIPPGAATLVHYSFELPADVSSSIVIEVALKYRKFDTRFLRHMQGSDFKKNDLPITVLASDRLVLPVQGVEPVVGQSSTIATWERWNDYGIGLLRKKANGELRQAEAAFKVVEKLSPAHGALNLARVYFKDGRLEEAARALRRAASGDKPAPAWTLAWYSALIDHEYGNLDQAIKTLNALVNTEFIEARRRGFDFSKDIRVLNKLGRVLYERARQERGKRRKAQRTKFLRYAQNWIASVLEIDPEDVTAHFNLSLIYAGLGEKAQAQRHQQLHDRYRPDDHAVEQAVSLHRRNNPAADHAAEAVAVYDLQRHGAYELADKGSDSYKQDKIQIQPEDRVVPRFSSNVK